MNKPGYPNQNAAAAAPIRLLLIEDNDGDAKLVQATLAEYAPGEFATTRVTRLAEALALIGADHFDAALADLSLPDSTGLNTVQALVAHAPALPVVVMTGSHDDGIGRAAVLHGAQDFLVKGESNVALLARTLRYAVDRKRLEITLREASDTLEARVAERTATLEDAIRSVRESEERYRAVTQSANDAIVTTDSKGKIVDWNRGAERIFGYTEAEICGQPLTVLMPDPIDDPRPMIGKTVELAGLRKNGDAFPLELSLTRWRIAENSYFTGFIRDITERKRTEQALHLRDRALEASANAVIITSATGPDYPVEYINPAFERITGYTAEEVIGRSLRVMHGDDVDQPGIAEIQAAIHEKREGHATLRNYRKDGSMYWTEIYLAPVRGLVDEISHFVAIKYDITETKRYQAELEFHASRDVLTGLPNRNLLCDRMNQAIAYGGRYGHPMWVAFVNLDRFTLVNNTLGHQSGDTLLKAIAARLQSAVRDSDTVARLGGDEFMLVLPERKDDRLESGAVQRIMEAVAQPIEIDGHDFFLTCCVGVAICPIDGEDAETLIKHAGIAMHRAKQKGSNNFQFYAPAMNEKAMERLRIAADLRDALVRDEFVLHFQPQVDFRTGRIAGMEALIRWNHPRLGQLAPDRFIGLAEETGMIVPIGAWVIGTACRQNKAWQDAGLGKFRVAVNLSAREFSQPDLAQSIVTVLRETGLDPGYLEIELTESMVMTEVDQAIEIMGKLKLLGVQLSIDDFGTGYSSLAYLKRFPIDALKIDRSFVRDIAVDAGDAAIAKAIVSMAHTIGIRVVAEGTETVQQCDFLRQNMCDELQGFFFSKALAAPEIEAMLRQGVCLPEHLLRRREQSRTLLLVDDETNIVAALKRLLRRDNYLILTANSGQEGLDILAQNENAVDVIVSDQRMPGMTGVEFLRKAKDLYPDTVRIVLSGYTELQSVTDAVNEGAIYKFLTKPWDDAQLRSHIEEAFRHKQLADENLRLNLEVQTANQELAASNRQLSELVKQKELQIVRDEVSLNIVREALQRVPLPVIGLDEENVIAFANEAAQALFNGSGSILGCDAAQLMPELAHANRGNGDEVRFTMDLDGKLFQVVSHGMGNASQSRGTLMTLTRCEVGQ